MPLLHMETELVRVVGNQLQQASVFLQQQAHQLDHSVQTLAGVWQSASAMIFIDEMQPLVQHLAQLAGTGSLLNQRLQREVDEWERVGGGFGHNTGSGSYIAGGMDADTKSTYVENYPSPTMPAFRLDPNELMSFRPPYIGEELSHAMRELNKFLADTYQHGYCADNPELIQNLANILGISYEESQQNYAKLIRLLHESGQTSVPDLSNAFANHWGSRRQMLFGKVIGDSLNIHPAFAAMLSPSGGVIGPGDSKLAQILDKDLSGLINENAWDYHGAAHDAAGHLYNNHSQLGPGYNYVGPPDLFSTDNPLSGQLSGYAFWAKQVGMPQTVIDTFLRKTRDGMLGPIRYAL